VKEKYEGGFSPLSLWEGRAPCAAGRPRPREIARARACAAKRPRGETKPPARGETPTRSRSVLSSFSLSRRASRSNSTRARSIWIFFRFLILSSSMKRSWSPVELSMSALPTPFFRLNCARVCPGGGGVHEQPAPRG
jgi:hypothetical protein